ncbi:hypothetical protein [Kutzneria albida]|uniref:Uncharacterized protein n=1 Tax=Kutzneria albida DSM 43870 TaxID=1449976 RepID=W5W0C6_9PSEU|nr:hypothetical protein [Kutzneria albida]AHH94225.1 hypothetical protein KALB_851 [Kutzneria albida DSM 43870]
MALTVGELTVGLRLDSGAFGQSLAVLRRELEATFVKTVATRAAPALAQLRKLLMSAVRGAVLTVARAISTRLGRAMIGLRQSVKQASAPLQFLAKLLRAVLLPALLALSHDGARSFARLASASVAAAGTASTAITTVVFGLDWLAGRALGTATTMITAWALAISPVPLVQAAVLGLAAAITAAWQALVLETATDFTAIWTFVTGTWLLITQAVQAGLDLVMQAAALAWQLVLDNTVVMWTAIGLAIQTSLAAVVLGVALAWQQVLDGTTVFFTALWTYVQTIWATILLTVQLATSAILQDVLAAWQLVLDATTLAFGALALVTLAAWTLVLQAVQQVSSLVVSTVVQAWQAVLDWTSAAFNQLYGNLTANLNALLNFVINWTSAMLGAFEGLRPLPGIVTGIFQSMADSVNAVLNGLESMVRGRSAQIAGALNEIAGALRSIGDEAAGAWWKMLLIGAAAGLTGFILTLCSEAILTGSFVLDRMAAAIQHLADSIRSLVDAVRAAGNLIGDFFKWVGGLFGARSFSLGVSGVDNLGALSSPRPLDFGTPAPAYGGLLTAAGAGGMYIENFYATPSQSPVEIAAELDWMAKGGG